MDLKSVLERGSNSAIKAIMKPVKDFFFDDLPLTDHATMALDNSSLSNLLPYFAYDDTTQLYQMEKSVGLILEIDPLSGVSENKTLVLSQLFGETLPDGMHVQILNWSSPKVGHKLWRWEQARAQAGGVLKRLARNRREHLQSGVWSSLSSASPFHLRDYRCVMAFELEGYADGEAGAKLVQLRETVKGTMLSLDSSAYNMTPVHLIDFVRAILNPNAGLFPENKAYDPEVSLGEQMVNLDTMFKVFEDRIHTSTWHDGDPFEETEGPLKSAETQQFEIRTFSVEKFPQVCDQNRINALLGDMFQSQIQPKGSNLTVLYFNSRSYLESKQTTEGKQIRANQQASSPFAKFMPSMSRGATEWNYVADKIQSGSKLCDMMMYVVQLSPRGQGEEDERYLRSVWLNAQFNLQRNDHLHMGYLLAALPCSMGSGLFKDFKSLKRTRLMITATMAQLAPIQGEPKGFAIPHVLLVGRRGQPFYWSQFSNEGDGAGGGNHNVAVIGGSGAGKSYYMQEMAVSLFSSGGRVDVFDDGESFKNTCKLVGGQHINFNMNEGICINPFSMCDHELALTDQEYMADTKAGIVALVLQMALGTEKPSQFQQGMVSQAVGEVWASMGKEGNITSVMQALQSNEPEHAVVIIKGLTEYVAGGIYETLFNGECNLKPDREFLVYELSPLESKPQLRAVVVLSLLMLTGQRMKFADRKIKKALFIDEAWKMLADGAAGEFIEGFARRCRKMGGSLVTGTQSLDDYERTSGAQACIQNSEWVILMKVKPESLARFENNSVLSCSEGEMQVLRSIRTVQGEYSEMYIRGPGCQVVGRFVADKYTGTLYSSKAETFSAINEQVARGVPLDQAVYNVAYKVDYLSEEEKNRDLKASEVLAMYPEVRRFALEYVRLDDEKARRGFISETYGRIEARKAMNGADSNRDIAHAAE